MRRLEVTTAGKWFLALTVLLGVVAINSGNNVIYLIESMLLSSLILSGVLSELAISSLNIDVSWRECHAGKPTRDIIHLTNRSRFFIFCMEVGVWKQKKFIPVAFIPRIPPKKRVSVLSEQCFETRGLHEWDGLVVATMYPFGFARKLRILKRPGQRIVWPSLVPGWNQARAKARDWEISEGDVREFQDGDDPRLVVWTLSARKGEWWVRQRHSQTEPEEFILDLGQSLDLEAAISATTSEIAAAALAGRRPVLVLKDGKSRRFSSKASALDALAIAKRPAA